MNPFAVIVRRRGTILAVHLAVAAACLPGLLRLEIDNSPERFFVRDAEALERFRDLELTFGRDRAVRLVVPAAGVWSREGLERLAALEEAAQDRERVGGGVYGALGLHRFHRWHLGGWPPSSPEAFRELATSDPLDRGMGWVSRDGRYVSLLVGLFKAPPERRQATLSALETLLPETGFTMGVPVVNRALDWAIAGTVVRTLPLLLAVVAALLVVAFRGAAALLPLALAALSQIVLFGAMGYAGTALDVVTVSLAPLTFVIAVATGVHVLAYHLRLHGTDEAERGAAKAVLETYRVKAWPVFWTGATTCAGFGSLAVATVPPVRWLGLWAAFGIAHLTLAALTFYPALLAATAAPRRSRHPRPRRSVSAKVGLLSRLGSTSARLALRRRGAVFAAFGALALAAAAGAPRLEVETDVLSYLPPEHPVRARQVELEAAGVGSVSASLVVSRPQGPGLGDPEAMRRLAGVAAALRDDPRVLGVVAPGDVLAAVARHGGEAQEGGPGSLAAARERIEATPSLRPLLSLLESRDRGRARILLATEMRGHRELGPLYRRAEALARAAFPDADVWVTGLYPLVLSAQRTLLRTMLLSISVAVGLIAAMLAGLLRSLGLAWRILIPNLWPVLVVVGAMGWLGVPVDSTTVMVASMVLGLAVDDTLHTVAHFRRALAGGDGGTAAPARAVVTTLGETAPGHVSTSLVLALGLAACGLSELVPVARVGALAAVGIAGALAADLLLVPALLASAPATGTSRR